MTDDLPDDVVLVRPSVTPSSGKYHTTRCFKVSDSHITKPREWARRSRIEECSYCAGTAASNRGESQESPAHDLRKQGGADD